MKPTKSIITAIVIMLTTGIIFAQRSDNKNEAWDTDNIQNIEGTVNSVDHPYAIFKDDNGNEYQVHLGPFWYWDQNQYQLQHNVRARIKGEVKQNQGLNEFYPWEIEQDGKTMKFADDNGVPNWSGDKGKGYGKGKGHGKGNRGNCPYRNK